MVKKNGICLHMSFIFCNFAPNLLEKRTKCGQYTLEKRTKQAELVLKKRTKLCLIDTLTA